MRGSETLVFGEDRRGGPAKASVLLRLLRVVDRLAGAGAALSAVLLLSIAVLFVLEILARALGAESMTFVWEYSGYFQAVAILLGSAYTLNSGGHIRVGIVMKQVSPSVQRALEALCTIGGLGAAALLCGALSYEAYLSFDIGRTSYFPTETPLFVPQAALALSALLLVLAFATRLVRVLVRLPVESVGPTSLQEG
jgi:TRAP-type mannitol/chloroaromatic compound transport system permease small subunit